MERDKRKEYPDWIQKHITDGTTVKEIRGKYYLYRRETSKRKEGKKNPQPVYEYLGTITEAGLVPVKKNRVDITDITVREYGFSHALEAACPKTWIDVQGENWKEKLVAVVVSRSRNSYFLDLYDSVPTPEGLRIQLGATVSSLGRKMKEAYGVDLEELQSLDTIYMVKIDGRTSISRISEAQQAVIDKLGIRMEVR